ncbi:MULTISPECIES: RbsD/FucU domain-containing protein [Rhodomicrobium]|uniref:RbsD/FucU family protein n=1 Tax=Rhodomicrobium TaxID=1068 RepID=UPI000B4B7F63|nr:MULTISPECIES: RbsD/FucU domain-containing protein [Rhodomicrobium]
MLIGIDPILSADLLHGLRAMGHGDTIVIADGSFPAATVAQRLVNMEAADLKRALGAILSVLPIDEDEPGPVIGMEVIGQPEQNMPAHDVIRAEVAAVNDRVALKLVERFAFYELAKQAFLVVATGERLFYGNVIIRKGTVAPDA